MREIAEKYPKGWELVLEELHKKYQPRFRAIHGLIYVGEDKWLRDFHWYFGYLVLEFFPAHGIYINLEYHSVVGLPVFTVHQGKGQQDKEANYFKTPQEAISKAFEILEKQLEAEL